MPAQTLRSSDFQFPFIVIEGIPGSGKTRFRDSLIRELTSRKIVPHHVGQHGWLSPTATASIVEARRGAIGMNTALLTQALIEDKKEHINQNIRPHRATYVVIADRFYASDLVLLACHGNAESSRYIELAKHIAEVPEVCFILDASVRTAKERLEKSRKSKRFLDSDKSIEIAASILASDLPAELCPNVVRLLNNSENDFAASLESAVAVISQLLEKRANSKQ